MLYGMTAAGGANNNGTIFQYNPATGIYTKKLDFDSTNGRYPYGNLMQASDGMLYGMAAAGGSNNMGVLFKYCIIAPTVTYTLTNNTPHHWVAYPTYSSNVAGARWYWGDGTDTLALYPSHTYSVAGRYSICVTAYSFCEDSAQYCQNDTVYRIGNNSAYSSMVYINVDSSSSTQTTVVNKLASNNEIIIYPNPAANGFMASYTGSIQEITLVDVLGNVVLNTTRIDIDISSLANGIYFVNLQTNEGLLTKKLIVQR